jgi:hypothetical protein
MSWLDRLNRLDERVGADRVGQGMRWYGLLVVWPATAICGAVFGTRMILDGQVDDGLGFYAFGVGAALFIVLGVRAEKSYQRYKRSRAANAPPDPPHVFDVE